MSYVIPNEVLKSYAFFLGEFTTLYDPTGLPITIQNLENPTDEDYKNIMLFLQKEFTYLPKVPQFILDPVPPLPTTGITQPPQGSTPSVEFQYRYANQLKTLNEKIQRNTARNHNRLPNTFDLSSVDHFFIIYYELERMKDYKNMLLNVLSGMKSILENVQIKPSRYQFDSSTGNIFNLTDVNNPDNLFKTRFIQNNTNLSNKNFYFIQNFIKEYQNNHHSLFSYKGSHKIPFFIQVFEENYQDKSKKFIMKMLMDYMQIVNFLQDNDTMNNYYGIMAFKYMLFFQEKPTFERKPKTKGPTNNYNLNFENEKIYNQTSSNINSRNVNSVNQSENSFNYLMLSSEENIYETYENENLVVEEQMEIIQKLFYAICEKLNSLFMKRTFNLYELMTISIELNYLTTKFIYNYVRKEQLKEAISSKIKIFKYIQGNIQIYNTFIREFKTWIHRTKENLPPLTFLDKDQKLSEVYKSFFKFYFDIFQKKTSQRKDEIRKRLEEEGLEYDATDSEGMSEEEIEELKKLIRAIESNSSSSSA